MKKLLLSLLITAIFLSGSLQARDLQPLSIGPFIALKGGVNGGNVQTGRKNAVSFNGIPDIGATLYMPASENYNIALTMDLAYSTYSFYIKDAITGKKFNEKYGYICLSPSFMFEYVSVGFNFGVPMYASYEGKSLKASNLNALVEFRLTGIYPLFSDPDATMNIILTGGYMFTGIYKDYGKNDPLHEDIPPVWPELVTTNEFNPRVVSFSVGFNYMFNLTKVEELPYK